MRSRIPPFLAAVLTAGSASAQVSSDHAVDYARLADLVVNRSWKIARGERVVFFWDRKLDRGIAAPLRAAVERAGGSVVEIEAPTSEQVRALSADARAQRDARWRSIFANADAAIWL